MREQSFRVCFFVWELEEKRLSPPLTKTEELPFKPVEDDTFTWDLGDGRKVFGVAASSTWNFPQGYLRVCLKYAQSPSHKMKDAILEFQKAGFTFEPAFSP